MVRKLRDLLVASTELLSYSYLILCHNHLLHSATTELSPKNTLL